MKKLFGFVMVGSNDLNKSAKFYDSVFVPLGIKKELLTPVFWLLIGISFMILMGILWNVIKGL